MQDRLKTKNMDLLINDPKLVDNFLDSPFTGQQFGFENYQPPAPAPDEPFDWGALGSAISDYDPMSQNLEYMLRFGNYMRPDNWEERLYDVTDASFEPYMSDEERAQLPLGDPRRDAISSLAIGVADVGAGAAVKAAPQVGRAALGATPDVLDKFNRSLTGDLVGFDPKLNIFTGEKGLKGKVDDMLELAKDLDKGGIDRKQIYNATGWFKGLDDKWRQEAVDDINILSGAGAKGELDFGNYSDMVDYGGIVGKYDDLFDTNMDLHFNPQSSGSAAYPRRGMNRPEIKIGTRRQGLHGIKGGIGHETQHPIQGYEGFSKGNNPANMEGAARIKHREGAAIKAQLDKDIAATEARMRALTGEDAKFSSPKMRQLARQVMDLEQRKQDIHFDYRMNRDPYALGFEDYHNLAGEVEARNVEARLGLTADDRRMQYPWTTEDVPADRQILDMGKSGFAADEDIPEILSRQSDAGGTIPVEVGGRKIYFQQPKRAKNEETAMVNVEELEKLWSQDQGFHIGAGVGGRNQISNRYEVLQEKMLTADDMDMPELGFTDRGFPAFTDGRHRTAVLRDMGVKEIPMSMTASDLKTAQKLGLVSDDLPAMLKPQSGLDDIGQKVAALEKETNAAQIHERGKGSSGTLGKSRDRVGTTGKYIGAPEDMDSPQKLGAMRKDYIETAKLGVAGRDWYDDSSAWIESVSPDSILAKQHADSLAVTSAGTNVDTNLGFSVKGTVQDATGTPVKTGRFPQNQSALLEEIHAGANPDLGRKRTPFAENLTVNWNPFVGDRAVHDIWQGRAMGYKGKGGKPFDRGFSQQEHAWMDQQMDIINPRLNEEAAGGFTDWNNLKTQAASWTGEKIKHGDILPEDAAMHYGSFSDKYQANATHEQVSGAGTGHLDDMVNQSPELRGDYSREGRSLWVDEKGRDMLYSDAGLMVEPDDIAMGAYTPESTGKMEFNPARVSHPLVADTPASRDMYKDGVLQLDKKGKPKKESVKKTVTHESRALLDAVEGTRAYVDVQNAGAWHKLIVNAKAGDNSSLHLPINRSLTEDEMRRVSEIAAENGMFAVDTGQGINIINDTFTDLGKKRTGVTLGREVKGKLGNDLKEILPEAQDVQRVTAETGYIDYLDAWQAGEGSGEATKVLRELFEGYPEVLNRLDSSEALRKKALSNLDRDIEWAERIGSPVRKDVQTARRIIAESGLKGLFRALDQGVALPVAVLGLTPLLLEEVEDGSI